MTAITPLIPRQPAPKLDVELVGGENWSLSAQNPQNFTMIVVYRGFHCPAFGDVLGAVKFVIANDYPGRGEVVD